MNEIFKCIGIFIMTRAFEALEEEEEEKEEQQLIQVDEVGKTDAETEDDDTSMEE